MPRSDAKTRLHRIDQITAQLKQGEPCTIQDLARQHGVSTRTIARDLALMRDQGLPIDADRGRGGGVRLDRNWGVGRMSLSYAEAVDLLISIAVAERMDSPLFLANLGAVRRQLVASFSPEKHARVDRLKSRILIGATASTFVQASLIAPAPDATNTRVVRALHRAFVDHETLQIRYRREDGTVSDREIEPHYLLLQYPVWYAVAMDHLRQEPRTFRCDRMMTAQATGTPFRLLPKNTFRPALTESARPE